MTVVYAYRYGIVGGVSTQLLLRQTALAEEGVKCVLFFSQDNGLRQMVPPGAEVCFGSEVSLRRLVARERPDAVVVVDSPELLRPAAGSFLHRTAVYLDVHTTTRTGLAYLNDVNLSDLAGLMVPSEYARSVLLSRLPDANVTVVPNILNTSVFRPQALVHSVDSETREFIWVGKLDNHKNWRLALVYTRLLLDLFGQVRLTVVGGYTAPEERALQYFDLACRLGISANVRWLDRVDNAAMASLYQRCAATGGAMIVTSRDESFGMAACEALLCGCPLIANDLPALREVLPGTHLVRLVDIWQPEKFASAAQSLAEPVSTIDAHRVNEHLHRRYAPEAYVRRFLAVLEGRPCIDRTN